jgi:protein-ribulosamine 3-kinase
MTEGEYHSARAVNAVVPGLVPRPAGWGEYQVGGVPHYFLLSDFHEMDLEAAPEPADFAARIAELHTKGTSPNGTFGFGVTTVIGKMERTVAWEASWATAFTRQLHDVVAYDKATNGRWAELDAACAQLVDAVIPRLLGALQSDGRSLAPALIHGDLWENNVGIDRETGETVVFDPGCSYAHNEMEFGTWRCSWAFHFSSSVYLLQYQRLVPPSEPAEEWDDRNRLYSIHPYLTDSAGHPGSMSRQM